MEQPARIAFARYASSCALAGWDATCTSIHERREVCSIRRAEQGTRRRLEHTGVAKNLDDPRRLEGRLRSGAGFDESLESLVTGIGPRGERRLDFLEIRARDRARRRPIGAEPKVPAALQKGMGLRRSHVSLPFPAHLAAGRQIEHALFIVVQQVVAPVVYARVVRQSNPPAHQAMEVPGMRREQEREELHDGVPC